MTHICVSKLTIIGSDNGLSPGRRQAIIWTNAGILLIRTLGTNFSEILGAIHTISFKKMHLKMSSAKWRLFRLGLNVLITHRVSPVKRLARQVQFKAVTRWYDKRANWSATWGLRHQPVVRGTYALEAPRLTTARRLFYGHQHGVSISQTSLLPAGSGYTPLCTQYHEWSGNLRRVFRDC